MLAAAVCLGAVAAAQDAPPAPPSGAPGSDAPGAPTEARAPVEEPREAGVPPVPGDDVLLIYESGERVEGVLERVEPDTYLVRISGVTVRVRPADLRDLVKLPPVRERYRQLRAVVREDDADALAALAEWSQRRGLLDEAVELIEMAIELEPFDLDLQRQRDVTVKLRDLARRRADEPGADPDEARDPSRVAPPPERIADFPLLTPEQVNLIKVYEVDLEDPPRILIPREVVDSFLEEYADNPLVPRDRAGRQAFRRRPASQILELMFRVRARQYYEEVTILGHPGSMRRFRDWVNAAWLANRCSSTRCHGGASGGRLLLFDRRPRDERVAYTNFLIIDRFRLEDGRPLIDYASPADSILLHAGLPRDDAIWPHPDVPGWSPVFRSRRDRGFRRAADWIASMYRPRPEYPIEYTPPGLRGEAGEGEGEAPVER